MTDREQTLPDRFVCRREGHDPMLKVMSANTGSDVYYCTCSRCGKWITVEIETGKVVA